MPRQGAEDLEAPAPVEHRTRRRRRGLKKGLADQEAKTERWTFYTSPEMRQVLKNLMSLASSEMMSKELMSKWVYLVS